MRSGSGFYRYVAEYVPGNDGPVFRRVSVYKLAPVFQPVDAPFDASKPDYLVVPQDFDGPNSTAAYIHTGPSCRGFDYRQRCKHVDIVRSMHLMAPNLAWYYASGVKDASGTVLPIVVDEAKVQYLSLALVELRMRSEGAS